MPSGTPPSRCWITSSLSSTKKWAFGAVKDTIPSSLSTNYCLSLVYGLKIESSGDVINRVHSSFARLAWSYSPEDGEQEVNLQ